MSVNVNAIEDFVQACRADAGTLHRSDMGFFRAWLTSMGATIPEEPSGIEEADTDDEMPDLESTPKDAPTGHGHSHGGDPCSGDHGVPEPKKPAEPEEDLDTVEAQVDYTFLEIAGEEGIAEEDTSGQEMGGSKDAEVAEADSDKASELCFAGRSSLGQQNFDEAIAKLTESITLDPRGTRAFSLRAKAFIKVKQPLAAIKDSDAVLDRNPDSAAGYKWRGRGYQMTGDWDKAFKDMSKAQAVDFDDETYDWIAAVKKNANAIREDTRKHERLVAERDVREKTRRKKKATREYERAKAASTPSGGAYSPQGGGG